MPRKKLLSLADHVLLLDAFDADEQDLKDRVHQRLSDRTEVDHRTGCMIYTGAWEANGQAKVRVGRRVYCVTRVAAWLYFEGFKLWDVRRVVHVPRCPYPACYNPEHLLDLANQAEAVAAQRRHGRLGAHQHPKLSKQKARDMRRMAAEGATEPELAVIFGVGLRAAKAVLAGETWRDD